MAAYLLELRLHPFTEELMALIPQHRAHINGLFEEGALLSYAVSGARDCIWCAVEAGSPAGAQAVVQAMPLYPAVRKMRCTPLLFHQGASATLPGISLN